MPPSLPFSAVNCKGSKVAKSKWLQSLTWWAWFYLGRPASHTTAGSILTRQTTACNKHARHTLYGMPKSRQFQLTKAYVPNTSWFIWLCATFIAQQVPYLPNSQLLKLFCSCKQHDVYVMEGGACNVVRQSTPLGSNTTADTNCTWLEGSQVHMWVGSAFSPHLCVSLTSLSPASLWTNTVVHLQVYMFSVCRQHRELCVVVLIQHYHIRRHAYWM